MGAILNGDVPGPILIEDSTSNYFLNMGRAKDLGFKVPESVIPFLGDFFID